MTELRAGSAFAPSVYQLQTASWLGMLHAHCCECWSRLPGLGLQPSVWQRNTAAASQVCNDWCTMQDHASSIRPCRMQHTPTPELTDSTLDQTVCPGMGNSMRSLLVIRCLPGRSICHHLKSA